MLTVCALEALRRAPSHTTRHMCTAVAHASRLKPRGRDTARTRGDEAGFVASEWPVQAKPTLGKTNTW